jgi:hypothetical protein
VAESSGVPGEEKRVERRRWSEDLISALDRIGEELEIAFHCRSKRHRPLVGETKFSLLEDCGSVHEGVVTGEGGIALGW